MLQSIQTLSLLPLEQVGPIQDLPSDDSCLLQSVSMRLLFVAQILVSALALPLIILVGLLEGSFDYYIRGDNETLTNLGNFLRYHILYAIPGSIVGAATQVITTKSCFPALTRYYEECAIGLKNKDWQDLSHAEGQQ